MPSLSTHAMPSFQKLGETWVELIEQTDLPGLSDGPRNRDLIDHMTSQSLEASKIDPTRIDAVRAGLWLLAGDIYRSHDLSQSIDSAEGSFWHGVMHRREHDFGNAKYWFRRVGSHPVIDQLARQNDLGYSGAIEFVDRCQHAVSSRSESAIAACLEIQWQEWVCMMDWLLAD